MPANNSTRRLVTIPTVVVLFVVVTVLAPVLVGAGAIVDLVRWMTKGKPWVGLRVLAFLWIYLLGELWALAALLLTMPLPTKAKLGTTFRLQQRWASWNFRALTILFALEVAVEGSEALAPGPVLVLSRHSSMVDTLLPATLISRTTGLRLRYVLKKELLVDPALDVAGNRLPNVFIDRSSRDLSEREAISDLAEGLGQSDGILIYPEGTRFSEAKLRRYQARAAGEETVDHSVGSLRRVLPPRPGGTLALLEVTTADVVVLAHHGLEGLATVADIWRGDLVGSTISVKMWRIPRSDIPDSRAERVAWLFGVWSQIDDWVVAMDDMRSR